MAPWGGKGLAPCRGLPTTPQGSQGPSHPVPKSLPVLNPAPASGLRSVTWHLRSLHVSHTRTNRQVTLDTLTHGHCTDLGHPESPEDSPALRTLLTVPPGHPAQEPGVQGPSSTRPTSGSRPAGDENPGRAWSQSLRVVRCHSRLVREPAESPADVCPEGKGNRALGLVFSFSGTSRATMGYHELPWAHHQGCPYQVLCDSDVLKP